MCEDTVSPAYNVQVPSPKGSHEHFASHDYETTGTDPIRDRPVQFASVRTDMDLNITGKPTTFYCRSSPDHLPDLFACLVAGITTQFCQQVGSPELQFVDQVHRQLGTPGTIAFGYNSIVFDDEVTRVMLDETSLIPAPANGRLVTEDGT